jgi:hypothetical protein
MKDEQTTGPMDPAAGEASDEDGGRQDQPAPRLRSTRGGAGAAAGATPKKASRPRSVARPRRAGKKAETYPFGTEFDRGWNMEGSCPPYFPEFTKQRSRKS